MLRSVSDRNPSAKSGLIKKLGRADYYRRAIERLHKKLAARSANSLYDPQPEGYSFAQAFFERRRLSSVLARSIARGNYEFSHAKLNDIVVEGKQRTVCAFRLLDHVVHGAVYDMLSEDFQPLISPHVYSYIKGRDKHQAIAALADFVRAHRKAEPDIRKRGIYVLRCDIKSYGISIPVSDTSAIWNQIQEAFKQAYGRPPSLDEELLLDQLIRPQLLHPEGGSYQRSFGIADGSSLSAWLLNLYASPVDSTLSAIEGGFYARYGDDMIFAHPDHRAFLKAEVLLDARLFELGLSRNATKTRRFFFNAAGRSAGDCPGNTHVEFLGLRLGFDATVSLKREKTRLLLRDLARRAFATHKVTEGLSFEERGKLICTCLNEALEPSSRRAHPYASMLRHMVNDRGYLRELDYQLARMVARATTGNPDARAFRRISYRAIREQWHLRSLEYARN